MNRKLVTCKTGDGEYKKCISDNATYFVEQLDPASVDTFHYKKLHTMGLDKVKIMYVEGVGKREVVTILSCEEQDCVNVLIDPDHEA